MRLAKKASMAMAAAILLPLISATPASAIIQFRCNDPRNMAWFDDQLGLVCFAQQGSMTTLVKNITRFHTGPYTITIRGVDENGTLRDDTYGPNNYRGVAYHPDGTPAYYLYDRIYQVIIH